MKASASDTPSPRKAPSEGDSQAGFPCSLLDAGPPTQISPTGQVPWVFWAGDWPRAVGRLCEPQDAHCQHPAERWAQQGLTRTQQNHSPGTVPPSLLLRTRTLPVRGSKSLASATHLKGCCLPEPLCHVPGEEQDRQALNT